MEINRSSQRGIIMANVYRHWNQLYNTTSFYPTITKVQRTLYLSSQYRKQLWSVRSGSGRHGQATTYLFQKHPLYLGQQYIVYSNGIGSVKVIFCVLLEFPFVKNLIVSKKLQSPAGYETKFLKHRENVWSCVLCVSP